MEWLSWAQTVPHIVLDENSIKKVERKTDLQINNQPYFCAPQAWRRHENVENSLKQQPFSSFIIQQLAGH
jgi:hypothetical protein